MAYFVTLLFFVILIMSFYVIIKDTVANMPTEELHAPASTAASTAASTDNSTDNSTEASLRANSAESAEESEPS